MRHVPALWSCLFAILVAAVAMIAASAARAAPITLTISTDTALTLKGAVTGRLTGTDFVSVIDHVPADFGYYDVFSRDFGSSGTNWNIKGDFYEYRNFSKAGDLLSVSYGISLLGRHLVAPHPDEIAPNNLEMLVYADNVSGATVAPVRSPASRFFDTKPHLVGAHMDDMILSLSDLNGDAPGFIGDDQFAATFVLSHPVPEPGTWAILAAGLGVLTMVARRRRVQ